MTNYSVVVIRDEKIIGVQPYDATNDGGRDARVQDAVDHLAAELQIVKPTQPLYNRAVIATDGNEWGKMSQEGLRPGMVELGFGKWGFEK